MFYFVKDTIVVYLFTFQNHDGDLVKYFDLVLTTPIHGYPYIQGCDWRAKKRTTRFLAEAKINFLWKSLQIVLCMYVLGIGL